MSRLLSLVTLPLFTRFLSPEEYGTIALLAVVGVALRTIFGLGLGPALGIAYFESNDPRRRAATVWTGFTTVLASTVLLNLFTLVLSGVLAALVLDDASLRHLLVLQVGLISLQLLFEVLQLRLQFEGKALPYVGMALVSSGVGVGASAALVAWADLGVVGWLAGLIIGIVIVLPVHVLLLTRASRPQWRTSIARELIRLGVPLLPSGILTFLMLFSGPFFVDRLASLTEAGIFNVGFQLGMGMTLVTSAFTTAWYPYFQSHVHMRESASEKFPQLVNGYVAAVGGLLLLFFGLAGVGTAILAAEGFRAAALVVGPIAASQFLIGFWTTLLPGMYFEREVGFVSLLQGGAAAVTVGAHLVLIPLLGAEGAAWAIVAGTGSLVLLQLAVNRWRRYDVRMIDTGATGRLALVLVAAVALVRVVAAGTSAYRSAAVSLVVVAVWLAFSWKLLSPRLTARIRPARETR